MSFLNYIILTNLSYILSCYLNNFVGRCSGTALKPQHSGSEDHCKFRPASFLTGKNKDQRKTNQNSNTATKFVFLVIFTEKNIYIKKLFKNSNSHCKGKIIKTFGSILCVLEPSDKFYKIYTISILAFCLRIFNLTEYIFIKTTFCHLKATMIQVEDTLFCSYKAHC